MTIKLNQCSAIILAGGYSRRMGRPKAMLPINGKPMIYHLVENLENIFDSVIVSVREIDENYKNYNCVEDIIYGEGPLVGIASALSKTNSEWNLIVPCDMPYVEMKLLTKLTSTNLTKDIILPVFKSREISPFPGFYRKTITKTVIKHLYSGQRSIMQFLKKMETTNVNVPNCSEPLNLNYFEDYENYLDSLKIQNEFNELSVM